MRKNDQGLRIENSTVTVENTTIEDNRHGYVILNNANVTIRDNLVQHNDRDGIYSAGSVMDIFDSRFEYNGDGDVSSIHGIYAMSGADISLGSRYFYTNPNVAGGFNTIRNNRGAGILVYSGANVHAGHVFFGIFYMAGSNSLHDNGTKAGTYNGKDFYNNSSTSMYAHNNYWGGNCPPLASQIYGPVYTNYCLWGSPTGFLTVAPDLPSPGNIPINVVSKSQMGQSAALHSLSNVVATVNPGKEEDVDTQIKKQLIADYKQLIASRPNSKEATDALQQLYSFVRTDKEDKLKERASILGYLNGLYNSQRNRKVSKTALQLMILERRRSGDLSGAISLSETALSKLSGDAKAGVMFNLVFMYLQADQLKNAQDLVATYKSLFPKDETGIEILDGTLEKAPAELAARGESSRELSKSISESQLVENKSSTPKEFMVFQNYPNPFNPETGIKYQLSIDSQVIVRIYNLQGQEIRTLVNEFQRAGTYEIRWDGNDALGSSVASGVYLYRLQAGDLVQVKKMTLLK